MEIVIREIAVSDYTEVVSIWNEVLGNYNVNDENFHNTMEEMNRAGNYKTFVAVSDHQVVGLIAVMQALAVGYAVGYLHIQGLAVRKEYQHGKIGTNLLCYVEHYAEKLGISSIILCSGVKRTGAHAFYEHNGYDKDSYCFDKVIKPIQ